MEMSSAPVAYVGIERLSDSAYTFSEVLAAGSHATFMSALNAADTYKIVPQRQGCCGGRDQAQQITPAIELLLRSIVDAANSKRYKLRQLVFGCPYMRYRQYLGRSWDAAFRCARQSLSWTFHVGALLILLLSVFLALTAALGWVLDSCMPGQRGAHISKEGGSHVLTEETEWFSALFAQHPSLCTSSIDAEVIAGVKNLAHKLKQQGPVIFHWRTCREKRLVWAPSGEKELHEVDVEYFVLHSCGGGEECGFGGIQHENDLEEGVDDVIPSRISAEHNNGGGGGGVRASDVHFN